MSARITVNGLREAPRKTFETPRFIHQEWPEHVARSCAAIRARRAAQSAVLTRDGRWFPFVEEIVA